MALTPSCKWLRAIPSAKWSPWGDCCVPMAQSEGIHWAVVNRWSHRPHPRQTLQLKQSALIKRAGDDYGLVKSPKTFIHASYEGRRLKPIMIRAATQKPECMTRKPSSADENWCLTCLQSYLNSKFASVIVGRVTSPSKHLINCRSSDGKVTAAIIW